MNNTGNYDDFIGKSNDIEKSDNWQEEMKNENGTGIGKLKIFVFTGNAALPVEGARVLIYNIDNNGRRNILYELTSNFDGETEEVTLKTPGIDNSMSPLSQAFAYYYVSIKHPDYVPVEDFAVQIFPDTITILPTDLQPGSGVY